MVVVQSREQGPSTTRDLHVRGAYGTGRTHGVDLVVDDAHVREDTVDFGLPALASKIISAVAELGVQSRVGVADGERRPGHARRHGGHGGIEQPAAPRMQRLEHGSRGDKSSNGIRHGVGHETRPVVVCGDETAGGASTTAAGATLSTAGVACGSA